MVWTTLSRIPVLKKGRKSDVRCKAVYEFKFLKNLSR